MSGSDTATTPHDTMPSSVTGVISDCQFCNKQFDKESSRRRHYYYCRLKTANPNASRRHSCNPCRVAKTRCDSVSPQCSRCLSRGISCEYKPAVVRVTPKAQSDQSELASNAIVTTAVVLQRRATASAEAFPVQNCSDLVSISVPDPDNRWSLDPRLLEAGSFACNDTPPGALHSSSTSTNISTSTDHIFQSIPAALDSPLRAFQSRVSDGPTTSKASAAMLVRRVLCSYPFRLLRRETAPPFICPQACLWAHQRVIKLEALVNCISVMQVFRAKTQSNSSYVWNLIRLEQDRLFHCYHTLDRWGLLGGLQALLVYCLLRAMDHEEAHHDFDAPLLVTCNKLGTALGSCGNSTGLIETSESEDTSWEDWVFNESLRRTILTYRILNMIVKINQMDSVGCKPVPGFALIPLPGSASLWHATSEPEWRTDFDLHFQARTIHGLSDTGDLVRLRQRRAGIESHVVPWEDWLASVGDYGTLIMAAASLL